MKKASVIQTGTCIPHGTDSGLIAAYLKKNGWVLTNKINNADVIIINTCAFKKEPENVSLKLIKKAQRQKNKDAQIIVTGCLPSINKIRLARMFKGVTIGANNLAELDRLLDARKSISDINYIGSSRTLQINKRVQQYNLRIGWGCYGKCSYCAIKFVFGRPRSRLVTDILQEFENAYLKGYREFILVANDSGSYGSDLHSSLIYLIDNLSQRHKDCYFSLSHLTPDKLKKLLPGLEQTIRSGRIRIINIPVESGSNRIIKLMKRFYVVDDFKYCVKKISELNPKLTILTDILVGFPSETGNDFRKTLRLVEWLGRRNVIFQCLSYSKRPDTEAGLMPGQIDYRVKQARLRKLNKLCELSYAMRDKNLLMQSKRRTLIF